MASEVVKLVGDGRAPGVKLSPFLAVVCWGCGLIEVGIEESACVSLSLL